MKQITPPRLSVTAETLGASLCSIEFYAERIMRNLSFPHFTDHSLDHAKRILSVCDRVLELNSQIALVEVERYVLVAACLLHDIGMQNEVAVEDAHERRNKHHELSAELIENRWGEMGILEGYAHAIALIAAGHRGVVDDDDASPILIGAGKSIRLDLLRLLLYLADELDLSFERVDIQKMRLQSLDEEESFHFYQHYYIQGVTIGDDHCAKITFRFPPERIDQYPALFIEPVDRKLSRVLSETRRIAQDKYGIFIAHSAKDNDVIADKSVESIDPDLFERIFSIRHKVAGFLFIRNLPFDKMVGDIHAELFYKGNVRWQDIVNGLDINRSQFPYLAKSLLECLRIACAKRQASCLLICGEAGSGKSTILMRLAFYAARNPQFKDAELLWLRDDAEFVVDGLRQLYNATQRPIIVFVDGAKIWDLAESIQNQMDELRKSPFPMVVIVAARYNEWLSCKGDKLEFAKLAEIKLDVLAAAEMADLLDKLEKFNQLYELGPLSFQERIERLRQSKGQLLVAMLEATRGRKFYDIILDEYNNIRRVSGDAAKAYELTCLLYYYDVLTPLDILITFSHSIDQEDLETRVLQHTRLVIVKHFMALKYGLFYRARHIEIARALMDNLEEYSGHSRRLKRAAIILRNIVATDKRQRYVIINFLRNYINHMIKFTPKAEYEEKLDEIRKFIAEQNLHIRRACEEAERQGSVAELMQWVGIFGKLRLRYNKIDALQRVLTIKPYDANANYSIASELSKTKEAYLKSDLIMNYYINSYKGNNRRVPFLLEFVSFAIRNGHFEALEPVIPSLTDFVSYSDEEEYDRKRIKSLLDGYQIKKDKQALANDFQEVAAHVRTTRFLKPEDELSYIDTVEGGDSKANLDNCEKYLITIQPNRPKGVLLRAAHFASKIPGEEAKAIKYYDEILKNYLKGDPQPDDYPMIFEYSRVASKTKVHNKEFVYGLFNKCIRLRPFDIRTYSDFATYALSNSDKETAKRIAERGLEASIEADKYNTRPANNLKQIFADL